MSDIVKVSALSDVACIRMTQSATGHVHSPWFTYDWKPYHSGSPYEAGSHFHTIRNAAISAFTDALKINRDDVVVTEAAQLSGHIEWRLGTRFPQPPLVKPATPKISDPSVIDI